MDDCIDVDYIELCVDEIALEGLDGITLSALWTRLQNRPNFAMVLDDPAKNFLWEICALQPDVEAFTLLKERPPLIIYNRFANVDSDTGLINEPGANYIDIYPICLTKDPNNFGSCETYYTRTNATSELRSSGNGNQLLMTLSQAMEKWGERLVLVASMERRFRALLGCETDPHVRLNQMQYAMLERIGRSRYLGEVTQGRYSLAGLHSSAKTLFYHRKLLLRLGLVIKQLHYQKSSSGQLRSGMLLHLTRFYVERKSKVILMLQEMCRFLQSKPNHSSSLESVRAHMGLKQNILRHTLKKCFVKLTESKQVAVRDLNPNAPDDQMYFNNKSLKTVQMLRLKDNVDPDNLEKVLFEEEGESGKGGAKRGTKKAGSDDEGVDEEDETMEEEDSLEIEENSRNVQLDQGPKMSMRRNGIPNPQHQVIDRPLLHQAYKLIEQLGPEGGSIQQLGVLIGVPRLETRALCRNLKRLNVVSAIMKDSGRQRITKFIAKRYTSTSQVHQELYKECQKMLEFTKGSAETLVQPSPDIAIASEEGKSENALPPISEFTNKSEFVTTEQRTTEEADILGIKQGPGTLLEDIKKICKLENGDEGLNLTSRVLKRVNLILQAVREAKVISNHVALQRLIMNSEADEGTKVDRKSIFRLISRLAKEGYLKYVHSIFKHGDKERRIHLICDPSLPNNDPLIISALEQAKFKHFAISDVASKAMYRDVKKTKKQKDHKQEAEATNDPNNPIRMSVLELRNLYDNELNRSLLEFNYKIGRQYGHEPKFMRLKWFHEFLFYLVYAYEGREDLPVPLEVKNAEIKQGLAWPKVYHPEISWKMFVSPLPTYVGWRTGWCLFSDVLLRMPLSLLVKLVNYNFKIEGIHEYLKDPIKCHLPISRLPQHLRNYLLYARKYIFSSHDAGTKLAYMGLLFFSQREHKDKDQVFMFVHLKARIVDTTISNPGYHKISADKEYPVRDYYLQTLRDLHNFWMDLETVCMGTPLGSYSHDQGKALTFETIFKKAPLIEAAASKRDDEIVDDWFIPGDGLGAGGLDSAFFSHLKRNWSWVTLSSAAAKTSMAHPLHASKNFTCPIDVGDSSAFKPTSLMVTLTGRSEESSSGASVTKKRLTRLAINMQLSNLTTGKSGKQRDEKAPQPLNNDQNVKEDIAKPRSSRFEPKVRTLKRKFHRIRKPYYDEKDKAALQLVRKQRVGWSSKEDSMLLLCKVASNLFQMNAKYLIIPFTAVRDFLHKHVEASKDKTSRACQRRLNYMLKNAQTVFNISVFVGESLQDKDMIELCSLPYVPRTNETEWISRFEAIMAKLLIKFKNPSTSVEDSDDYFPNTLDEFYGQFSIRDAKEFANVGPNQNDVKNVVDIHFNVVSTMILSSVATVRDGTNWAYYLYQIYQEYPESLLLSALAKHRSAHVLSKRKNFGREAKRRMLLINLPYQLSVKYDYLFLSQFREHIFSESYEMMKNLLHDMMNNGPGFPITIDHEGGYAATVIALAATKKIHFEITVPDEVIILNVEELDRHCKAFIKKMQVWESKVKAKQENSFVLWAERIQQKQVEKNASSTDDSEQPGKRIRLDTDAEDSKNPDGDKEELTQCFLMVDGDTSKINEPPLTRSSRFALYMLRQEITEPLVENSQHLHDYLLIKPCTVQCRLNNLATPMQPSYPFTPEEIQSILGKVNAYLPIDDVPVDKIKEHYCSMGYGEEVIQEMAEIYHQIFQRNEMGQRIDELRDWFKGHCQKLPLATHLDLMTSGNLIISVGVVERRVVALRKAKPWLIHTYKIKVEKAIHVGDKEVRGNTNDQMDVSTQKTSVTDSLEAAEVSRNEKGPSSVQSMLSMSCKAQSWHNKMPHIKGIPPPDFNNRAEEKIRFIGRPWRKPDGAVNAHALRFLLNGIMTYIMTYPGVTLDNLCKKYATVLSPVQLTELLDILKEAKCVHKSMIKRSHEEGPFSPPVSIIYVDEEGPGVTVCYDPEVDCVVKLSQLLSNAAMESLEKMKI